MKFLMVLFAGIIIGIGGLYFYRNILVESAVEEGSSYALGVETDLGSAGLELSGGSLELDNFEVSNPEGFTADNFLVINNMILDVNEGSLLDDEVIIDSFVIDGLELNFEQIDAKGNYQQILNNIKKLNMSSSESSEQKFQIKKVSIRNISVNALYDILGNSGEKKFEVKDITLKNIGGDNGATIGEITAKIVNAVTSKAIAANNNFPTEEYLKELGDKAGEVLKDVTDDAAEKLEELGKSIFGK